MRRKFYSLVLILVCAAIILPTVGAQGRSDAIVIRNARIFTVTKGVIENGSIVITGGKITAVGVNVSAPGGARVIDARGLSVYPGMIDSGTSIGLTEVGQGAPGTVDTSELGDNNANIHVEVAINPESTHIGVTRVNGITTVLTMPRGGLIAGQFPTYLGALDAWRTRRPAYRNLVLDSVGFDPVASLTGAQFAYTVPNFSNPTGRLVGLDMRQKLVDAAHRTGTWLVEDDPYGGLHFDGDPLARMIELSGWKQTGRIYDGPVVYMGTLSKEIAPGNVTDTLPPKAMPGPRFWSAMLSWKVMVAGTGFGEATNVVNARSAGWLSSR